MEHPYIWIGGGIVVLGLGILAYIGSKEDKVYTESKPQKPTQLVVHNSDGSVSKFVVPGPDYGKPGYTEILESGTDRTTQGYNQSQSSMYNSANKGVTVVTQDILDTMAYGIEMAKKNGYMPATGLGITKVDDPGATRDMNRMMWNLFNDTGYSRK